jgi:hypothetical protein
MISAIVIKILTVPPNIVLTIFSNHLAIKPKSLVLITTVASVHLTTNANLGIANQTCAHPNALPRMILESIKFNANALMTMNVDLASVTRILANQVVFLSRQ